MLDRFKASGAGRQQSDELQSLISASKEERAALSTMPPQVQHQGADRADGGRTPTALRHARSAVASLEQVAMPAQDRVRADQQHKAPQLVGGEVVEQAGEERAVGVSEGGLADPALQDEELVPERKDLDVFLTIAHRQQAQERQRVGRGEVGQAQQHDRS